MWEEFGEIWDALGQHAGTEVKYEELLTERETRGLGGWSGPTRQAICELVQGLDLEPSKVAELTDRLYRVAAAYRIPKLKIELGKGAAGTERRLANIARAANELADLLASTDLDVECVLHIVRRAASPAEPLYSFEMLSTQLRDLAESSQLVGREIPIMSKGSSINVMQARLMEAATAAIGAATNIEVKVKQADSAGRNPRAGSESGELLFRFVDLVDPAMTNATKVRLFRGFNKAWKSVSWREIEAGTFPKRWPNHDARAKLMK